VAPNELVFAQEFAQNLEDALKAQFALCSKTPECAKAFGDPYASLIKLRDALREKAQAYAFRDPVTFNASAMRLTDRRLAGLVRLFAYAPETAALLPLSIAEGLKGNYTPLAGQSELLTTDLTELRESGMQTSVMCAEDADLLTPRPQDKDTVLGTALIDVEVTAYDQPIDYNPCLECKLCVAACPTGAISPDGHFNFSACYTHNYREFMGGFNDWVENIADSRSAHDYRKKVSGAETVSMWQSLSFGANYKAAYCMAVCPAGEDVIAPFLTNRKQFLDDVVRPLQNKPETVYVVANSDAEEFIARRFPHKKTKRVSNGLAGQGSIRSFLRGLNFVFQKGQSKGLNAVYHFTFTGEDDVKATVTIRDEKLLVSEGHNGQADLRLTADSQTWLRFLRKEANLVWALLRRKIRIQGSPKLLLAFGRCFPS